LIIEPVLDEIFEDDQKQVPSLESQSVADNDAEVATKGPTPQDATSLQASESVVEGDFNLEAVPVNGPVDKATHWPGLLRPRGSSKTHP